MSPSDDLSLQARVQALSHLIILVGEAVGVSLAALVLSALHEREPLVGGRPLPHEAVLGTLESKSIKTLEMGGLTL